MFTIPDNAITATIYTTDKHAPFYAIPFSISPKKTQFPNGTTLIVLGRDESGEWLNGVVISEKTLVHGWIPALVTRNLMAGGRLIKPDVLPISDYAYNAPEEIYAASRFQKMRRGVAGIRVYGGFLLVFTLICIAIGAIAGVLFVQETSDVISKFLIGAGFGGVVGVGIGWIIAFVPMARDEKFQIADARYKALVRLYRARKQTVMPLASQADLDKATSKTALSIK